MATFQEYPRAKQVSYAEYEAARIQQMEDELMEHHNKNFSQLHKDLIRKEHTLITL
tara:strand:+ start:601 stop:768 length:168 start_codon:yes stop_codon:yes gene_type:complete